MDDSTDMVHRLAEIVLRLGGGRQLQYVEEMFYTLTDEGFLPEAYTPDEADAFLTFVETVVKRGQGWLLEASFQRDRHAALLLSALKYARKGVVARQNDDALTPREKELAGLFARGMTDEEIAESLTISPKTAKTHRQNVADKWGCTSSLADLRRVAIEKGYS